MISIHIYLISILSSIFILLSVRARYANSGRVIITDPFYITIAFYFLYYVVGQFGRNYLESVHEYEYEYVYVLVAFMVLLSTIVLFYLTKISSVKRPLTFFDGDLCKEGKIFMLAAIICLIVGYVFWYLNYARLGDWVAIMSEYSHRSIRNAKLTSMMGNLPFTHFMYIGYSFILTSLLFKGNSVIKSTILSLLLVSPLLFFYIAEGERTAILKYIFSSFFIISFIKYKGYITLRKKHIVILALLFIIMSLLGSIRGASNRAIATGDFSDFNVIINKVNNDGISTFMPSEFTNVNFTLNRTVNDIVNGKQELLYGSSYMQSIPYLFPRSVYKVFGLTKEPTIADKFGEMITKENNSDIKQGFGMSAIAEAFANFHIAGMLIFPILLISILNLWSYIAYSSSKVFTLFLMLILTPLFVFIHRSSFASTFSFVAYVSFISYVAYWLSSVIFNKPSLKK